MNGHILVPDLIAVDFWKENAVTYFFLTHCHGDHVSPKLRRWKKRIFTSELNCQILQLMFDVPRHLLVAMEVGQTRAVGDFQVTPLDAHHCPGSLALLFQGDFGTILYSGDLRYRPALLQESAVRYVLRPGGGGLDRLYIDNTYCSPECVFPPRLDVLDQVIRYLRECDDSDIYIGMRELGKERAVLAIAEALGTRVHVSRSRLKLLQLVAPSPLWTTDEAAGRLRLVPFARIGEFGGQTAGGRPRVALLLTALYAGSQPPAPYSGGRVQVFPYSDHSSFPELCELVRAARPRQVLPLVKRWTARGLHPRRDLSTRADMAVFRTYLRVDSPPRHPALVVASPPGRLELELELPSDSVSSRTRRRPELRSELAAEPGTAGRRHAESLSGDTDLEAVQEAVQRPAARPAPVRGTGDSAGTRRGPRTDRRAETAQQPRPGTEGDTERGPREAPDSSGELPSAGPTDHSTATVSRPAAGQTDHSTATVSRPAAAGESARRPVAAPRPCPFLVVAGKLERLERVLYTQEEVALWLASSGSSPVVCGEISSSCC